MYSLTMFSMLIAELKEAQWNIVNVSKVWLRMIRSLDDVNNICDPRIHANVMNCLAEVWRMLIEVSIPKYPK